MKWIVFYVEADSAVDANEDVMVVTADSKEEAEKSAVEAIKDLHFEGGMQMDFELISAHRIANDADELYATLCPDAFIKCRGE